jgi:hypothetical protein
VPYDPEFRRNKVNVLTRSLGWIRKPLELNNKNIRKLTKIKQINKT